MIKRRSSLSCVAILCGVLGFEGSQMPPSENGRFRDVDWGRTAAHPNQLARQQNHTTETPDQWVDLGQRVHGGFGSYLALGIRIGLDAMHRLNATARTLDVTYYNGAIAPCPCVVDGIMIATTSTPGQNLLRVASTPSPEGTFGVAEIHDRTTGKILRYTIPDRAKLQLDTWNQVTSGRQRYDAVMRASEETLFSVKMIR